MTLAQIEDLARVVLPQSNRPVGHWDDPLARMPTMRLAAPRPVEEAAPFVLARPPQPNRVTRRMLAKRVGS